MFKDCLDVKIKIGNVLAQSQLRYVKSTSKENQLRKSRENGKCRKLKRQLGRSDQTLSNIIMESWIALSWIDHKIRYATALDKCWVISSFLLIEESKKTPNLKTGNEKLCADIKWDKRSGSHAITCRNPWVSQMLTRKDDWNGQKDQISSGPTPKSRMKHQKV